MLHKVFGHPVHWEKLAHWVGWNIFLAVIPVILGYLFWAAMLRQKDVRPVFRALFGILLFLLWLAFVPNTCYLFTEWRHFIDSAISARLYSDATPSQVKFQLCTQAIFFLCYSGAGLLCFVLAIRPVERALQVLRFPFTLLALPLFLLISFGVYLGLILRLNSWDLVRHPLHILDAAVHAAQSPSLSAAVVIFALLLWGLYEGLDIWVDGIVERWRQWRSH